MGVGQLGQAFQCGGHSSLVLGATPACEVVRGKDDVGVPGGHIPHPVDFLRLASAADGDWDAETFGAVPESVATRIIGLGLTLETHALHPMLVHPVREFIRSIGGSRVQDPHGYSARDVLLGAVALVDVIETVSTGGLH